MKYTLTSLTGAGDKLEVRRNDSDSLELKIGDKSITVLTEDLATLIRQELPEDRAREMFSETEEKAIEKGKARVQVVAQKDIKKGDYVAFTIEINKYLDRYKNPFAIRTTKSGFIF